MGPGSLGYPRTASGLTTLASDDDYVYRDSMIRFTPATAGIYLGKVTSFDVASHGATPQAMLTYTLGVHLFVDADGDGWSSYYDCDEANPSIRPFATDVPGDGIDQDCNGADALVATSPDPAEPDNDAAHAHPMLESGGSYLEWTHRHAEVQANARTITAGDPDWFSLSVPAHARAYVSTALASSYPTMTVYDADAVTTVAGPSTSVSFINGAASSRTYYAKFTLASGSSSYIPYWYDVGTDLDGDGSWSKDRDGNRDCNDSDPAIHPYAAETPADGVDSNCNGQDSF